MSGRVDASAAYVIGVCASGVRCSLDKSDCTSINQRSLIIALRPPYFLRTALVARCTSGCLSRYLEG